MRIAEFIVATLLENDVVRVCAGCQQQFGFRPPPNASHGYCKRHLIDMQKQVLQMAAQRGNQQAMQTAQQRIRDIQQRPDSDFPPDMAHQQNAAVAQ